LLELHYARAYVINNNDSSNNLSCYPPDSHQCDLTQAAKISVAYGDPVLNY